MAVRTAAGTLGAETAPVAAFVPDTQSPESQPADQDAAGLISMAGRSVMAPASYRSAGPFILWGSRDMLAAVVDTTTTTTTASTGSTTVGGTISANTTWGVAGSPYIVQSNVVVSAGVTLTIEPGTIIKFNAGTNIQVNGDLEAVGQAGTSIIFTSAKDDANGGDTNGDGTATTPAAGDWYSVESAAGGTVNLAQTQVLYGGKSNAAVYSSGGNITADTLRVQSSATRAVQIGSGSLTNSTLSGYATSGVYVTGGSPSISGDTMSGGNYGVYANAGTPTINNNQISGSASNGIYVYAGAPAITNNQVSGTNSAGIYYYNYGGPTAGTLTGNTVTSAKGYAVDIALSSQSIGNLQTGSNSFTGNTYNGYGLSGTFTGNTTLPLLEYPWLPHGVTVGTGATLTVQAGTLFKVVSGSFTASGAVNLNGTSAEPIVFTSVKDDQHGGDTNGDGTATAPAAGDWYAVESASGGTVNLAHAQVLYGGKINAAVYSSGGTITADTLTVQYSAARAVQMGSGSLTNSTLSGFATTGVYVTGGSPTINGNSISGGNYGIAVYGTPAITNNQISGSAAVGIYYGNNGGPIAGTLTGNTVTSTKGYAVDIALSSQSIGNLQTGSNSFTGNAYNGFGLSGTFAGNTTLPILEYPWLPHGVTVGTGATLTVQAGTLFKVVSGSFTASGTLSLNGTSAQPIVFTSAKDDQRGGDTNSNGTATNPSAGDWSDVESASGGTLNLSQVQVFYSSSGVYSSGGAITANSITVQYSSGRGVTLNGGSLTNSTIANFSSTGIYVNGASPTVTNNQVSGGASNSYGIYVYNGSPSVSQNQITSGSSSYGFYVSGGTPSIDSNTVSGGKYGFYVNGGTPSITNNQIGSAATAGVYYSSSASAVGTLSGNTITGGNGYPVDISAGARALSNFILGSNTFSDNATNGYGLSGTTTGTVTLPILDLPWVFHGVTVGSGSTLTLPAGTLVKTPGSNSFTVNGTLNLNGTPDAPVIFTSIKDDSVGGDTNNDGTATSPAASDWNGLSLSGGSSTTATNVTVRYAGTGISHTGGTANLSAITVTDSSTAFYLVGGATLTGATTRNVSTGVKVAGGSPTVSGNTVSASSYGIYVEQASPTIQNNQVDGAPTGIYVHSGQTAAQPAITGNTVTHASSVGIYLYADSGLLSGMTVTGNTVNSSGYAARIGFGSTGLGSNTISGNQYSGNRHNGYLLAGNLKVSSAFYPLEYPYVVDGFSILAGATGVFNAGSIVKLPANGSGMGVSGLLDARGTADQPVVFTSEKDDTYGGDTNGDGSLTSPAPGDWDALDAQSGGTVQLDHAKVFYGGYAAGGSVYASSSMLQVTYTEVAHSLQAGIYLINDGPSGSLVANSTIHDNPNNGIKTVSHTTLQVTDSDVYANPYGLFALQGGPYLESNTFHQNGTAVENDGYPNWPRPLMRQNQFTGNTHGVVDFYGNVPIDARFNWWGDESGPAPVGKGDSVGPSVSVGPWIGREYQDARLFGSAWWAAQVLGVNMVTGNWSHADTDVTITGGKGFPLQVNRTYNSLSWANGSFGYLWQFNYDLGLKEETDKGRVTVTYGSGQESRYTINADGTYTPAPGEWNQLVNNPDGSWRLSTKQHSLYDFDPAGHITDAIDQNGNTTRFAYDANGGLSTVTDASGRQLAMTRDSSGRITAITDPAQNTVHYTYDSAGNLATVTDVRGQVTRYTYDGDHRLLSITASDNSTPVRLEYDSETRVAAVYDGTGAKTIYAYDVTNRANTVTDPRGNQTKTVYDANLRLMTATDPLGYTVTRSYDAANNIISVKAQDGGITSLTYDSRSNLTGKTDPLGNLTQYAYDTKDNLLQVTDPLQGKISYTYDDHFNRVSQTDPLGRVTQYQYDANGLMTAETDPAGQTTQYGYDAYGNPSSSTDPLGQTTSVTYDLLGRVDTQTDRLGGVTQTSYDAAGHLLSVTDPLGGVTQYAYDALGRRTSMTDAEGRTVMTAYDAAGHVTKQTDPLGASMIYTYDGAGNQISVTDQLGNTTQYAYDARNQQIRATDSLGHVVQFSYDAKGNRTGVTDANGNTVTSTYDLLGRLIKVTDPNGQVTQSISYDALGHVVSKTDGNGQQTQYQYDAAGQQTAQTDPLGNVTHYAYDADGNQTTVTDPRQAATIYRYDPLNRLAAVSQPTGDQYTYAYDAEGHLTGITDPNQHVVHKTYDLAGRLTIQTDAAGAMVHYGYDKVGNRLSLQDAAGGTTTYQYDAANRQTSITAPDGTSIQYGYDAAGHRTSMTDGTGTTTYQYDAAGRLTQVTVPGGANVQYAYDQAGNVTRLTDYSGQAQTRTYDKRNRLAGVQTADGAQTSYTYDGADQWLSVTYPGGVKAEAQYDAAHHLTSLINRASDGTGLGNFAYTYDALGQKVKVVDDAGTTEYLYDVDRRLQQVTEPDGGVTAYTYDGAGNRVQQTVTPAGGTAATTRYAYDAANRLTTVTRPDEAVITYAFDARGNLTSDGNKTYQYDGLNRLVAVQQGTDTLSSYQYNGDGLRVAMTRGGVTTHYYYDGDHVLNEGDGSAITVANTWGIDLIRRVSGGQTGYYLFNGHADVVGVTDPTGVMLNTYRYDAFGSPTASTGSFDNPFRYAGEPYDPETGSIYLRARYYQPEIGRFLTEDTWKGDTKQPGTQNTYVYTGNNPVNYVDPTGHCIEDLCIGEMVLGGMALSELAEEYGPEVVAEIEEKLPEAEEEAASLAQRIWDAGAVVRGRIIEGLQDIEGWFGYGNNVWRIDGYDSDTGLTTSVKSIDLAAKSYQNGSRLLSTLKGMVNSLANYEGGPITTADGLKTTITQSDIGERLLKVVIPDTPLSPGQVQALTDAMGYAQDQGVTLEYTILK